MAVFMVILVMAVGGHGTILLPNTLSSYGVPITSAQKEALQESNSSVFRP